MPEIVVVITARPSYARVKSVLSALQSRGASFGVVAAASALLERYGRVVDVIRKDGFPIISEVYSTYEGATLQTSAKETGALCTALAPILSTLSPRCVVVLADRHEVLGAAQAASYLHLPLLHIQGGERTGSIDDRVRDSITALADYHCTSTELARWRVYGLTGSNRIWNTGCPSVDLARVSQSLPPVGREELGGHGSDIDPLHPFILILQHPVTNEASDAGLQMMTTLLGTEKVKLPRIIMWPGQEAGAEAASKAIRTYMDAKPHLSVKTVRNLPPERFLRLLSQAAVLVGNSSAGIREASFLGVPVVNIGSRQFGRERALNVIDTEWDTEKIQTCVEYQRQQRYQPSTLYGQGDAGERIAEILCTLVKPSVSSPPAPKVFASLTKTSDDSLMAPR